MYFCLCVCFICQIECETKLNKFTNNYITFFFAMSSYRFFVYHLLLPIAWLCLLYHQAISKTFSTKGIDIPYIKATNACRLGHQPQLVTNIQYGIVLSPRPEILINQSQFNCTWLVQVPQNLTIKANIEMFELLPTLGVDFIDGPDVYSPLIGNYNGTLGQVLFQTKTNQLFIRYYGQARFTWTSEFNVYFEESAPKVWSCPNDTIRCRNELKCVHINLKCDDFDHCGDGTDEQDCLNVNVTFAKECGHANEYEDVHDMTSRIVGGDAILPGTFNQHSYIFIIHLFLLLKVHGHGWYL